MLLMGRPQKTQDWIQSQNKSLPFYVSPGCCILYIVSIFTVIIIYFKITLRGPKKDHAKAMTKLY